MAAIAVACVELDGRISAALRPEGYGLPWATYEMREDRAESSGSTLVVSTMELTIWHDDHAVARQWATRIASSGMVVAGERAVFQQQHSMAETPDDGKDDAERACTLSIQVAQHTANS